MDSNKKFFIFCYNNLQMKMESTFIYSQTIRLGARNRFILCRPSDCNHCNYSDIDEDHKLQLFSLSTFFKFTLFFKTISVINMFPFFKDVKMSL